MCLPGFGWPNFHVQGCDSPRHAQRLILIHLPSCFQLLQHQELLQGSRAGSPSQGPSHSPSQGPSEAPLPVAPVGRGPRIAVHRALRWPVTLNTVFFTLKTTCSRVSCFSSGVTKMWGNSRFLLPTSSILAVRNCYFSITVFFRYKESLLCVYESLHRYFIYRLFQVICCGIRSWQNFL